MYEYKAEVIRIVDGDTIELKVDMGFRISNQENFRFARIDTAEIFRPRNRAERIHGLEAARWLKEHVLGKEILIHTEKDGKYGRWLIEFWLDGENIQDTMFSLGFEKREFYE